MKFIEKLHKKSRSTRILILWLASFLVMFIIIIVWLFSFSKNFNPEDIEEKTKTTGLPSLFESIKKDFSTLKQGIGASIKKINKLEENAEERTKE